MLIGAHNSVARLKSRLDLWVFHFKQETLLVRLRVLLLNHAIPRATDLGILALWQPDFGLRQVGAVLLLAELAAMQVCLVLFACGMRQIRRFVGVQSEAEAAFEGT